MFQSGAFWFVLAASLLLYWSFPRRLRNGLLILVSFGLLVSVETEFTGPFVLRGGVAALALACIVYFTAGRLGGSGWRAFLLRAGAVLLVLGYLATVKYLPGLPTEFFQQSPLAGVAVPLGASFYTFKLVHYVVEVARGGVPRHTLGDFLAYILLFPTFPAGPIERIDHFLANRQTHWSWDLALNGGTRIIHGLVKRFAVVEGVLTPMLGASPTFEALLSQLDAAPGYRVWWFLGVTYLIAYLDFSAYSDIAIGASRLFGFRILENFNFPIAAASISDFWRRWHMTLAGWCQSYVYMPLIGLTRNPYAAVYATFLVMGVWHAASAQWIAWGLYHATGVAVHNAWTRWNRRRRRASAGGRLRAAVGLPVTFLFVSGGYAFTTAPADASLFDSLRVLWKAVNLAGFAG